MTTTKQKTPAATGVKGKTVTMNPHSTIAATAAEHLAAGLSVIPIFANGSKKPTIAWKEHQARRMTPDEVRTHFAGNVGIAVVCGKVSGGLEVLDIEGANKAVSPYEVQAIEAKLEAADPELFARLYRVRAPGGGLHLYYRCEAAEGNQPLARKMIDGAARVLIETRGEGGYVLGVGCPAACHPTGKLYAAENGNASTIPTITAEQRAWLFQVAKSFDEAPEPEPQPERQPRPSGANPPGQHGDSRAGDWFNANTAWADILQPHGWTFLRKVGQQEEWIRPGKKERALSAATNHDGTDRLHVFSMNAAPLEEGRYYDKFGAFARLNHGGDMTAAARAVRAMMPGESRAQKPAERVTGHAATYQPAEQHGPVTAHESAGERPRFHLTDLGNAERFIHDHQASVRYVHPWDAWLVWDGARWKRDDSREIYRLASETVRGMYRQASTLTDSNDRQALAKHAASCEKRERMLAMIDLARNALEVAVTNVNDLDADLYALNVENGTIDLRTGKLRPHRREDYITKLAPVAYDRTAKAPNFTAFLKRTFNGDRELIAYLLRFAGYSLTGDVSEHKMPILHGIGANGKTTLITALSQVLGPDYATETGVDTLLLKRDGHGVPNDLARLVGYRLVSAAESDDGKRLAEARIKAMTGGDRIVARFLHKEYFEFKPQFKIWLSTNHRPEIMGTDLGIWRRVKLVPFDVVIPADEQRADYFEHELRPELPGILNMLLIGCLEWQRHGLKVEAAAVTAATTEYRSDSDALGRWMEERCVIGDGFTTKSSALYPDFRAWMVGAGEQPLTQNAFGRRLVEAGFKRKMSNGPHYEGIGLKVDDDGRGGE